MPVRDLNQHCPGEWNLYIFIPILKIFFRRHYKCLYFFLLFNGFKIEQPLKPLQYSDVLIVCMIFKLANENVYYFI